MKACYYLLFIIPLLFFSCSKDNANSPVGSDPDNQEEENSNEEPQKKVLLVGIDGLYYDEIAQANTPNLDKLNTITGFTGGYTNTATQQYTFSGPGWMTVLTGTWVDKHDVPSNLTNFRNKAKTVFNYIRENKPDAYLASIVNWDAIHTFQENQIKDIDYTFDIGWDRTGGDDSIRTITDKAIEQIKEKGPDLIFAMYVNVDDVGHLDGFGATYNAEIEKVDVELGKLMEAVEERETEHHEDWLILVSTDHGRQLPEGVMHGGLSTAEKTIFIKMNKPGNASFNTFVHEVPDQENEGIYGYPAQTAITSTILRYLGIDIQDSWELAGSPLIGTEGPMRLMFANEAQDELYWYSQSSGRATIYKNGEKIGDVPANQGGFKDEDTSVEPDDKGIIRYVVSIDGSTEYISKKVK